MSNDQYIVKLISDLFQTANPKIDEARRQQIQQFVTSTINGDNPQDHLIVNATLAKDKQGTIIYILTDVRLIKIDIDGQEVLSSSFPINTITNIERKLVEGDRAQIGVYFQNDYFGLRYAADNQKIIGFFQKVDQSRTKAKSND